jgi:hypothetical protein
MLWINGPRKLHMFFIILCTEHVNIPVYRLIGAVNMVNKVMYHFMSGALLEQYEQGLLFTLLRQGG